MCIYIFSGQKPNVGQFAKILYLFILKRNVWRTNNVKTRDISNLLPSALKIPECHKYTFFKVCMPITQKVLQISQYDFRF